MKLVRRAEFGWPASEAPLQATTRGVKVHYEGTPVSVRLLADHGACVAEWKAIRASHLANTKENYSDVAYNYAACPHGFLLEGRGIGRRTGANGNQDLNRAHYAIVGLVGSEGLTQPTDAMLGAIRDGIELLRENGAGNEIKGHRDGYATDCPGGPLYAWVQKGAPRPAVQSTNPTAPSPEETDVPSMLDTNNAIDVPLPGGEWTPLALPAQGGTILAGPRLYDVGVHLSLTGLPPGARVEARFYRVTGKDRSDRRPQQAHAAEDGTVDARFADAGQLAAGESLHLDVRPAADCTLIHRAINGPHWATS